MTSAPSYFIGFPVDGVVGLGYTKPNGEEIGIQKFIKNIPSGSQHFTVYIQPEEDFRGYKGGFLTLGESDTEHCSESGQIFGLPKYPSDWIFQAALKLDGEEIAMSRVILVKPESKFSFFQKLDFEKILKAFDANTYDSTEHKYSVECKDSYPKIEITTAHAKIVIGTKLVEEVIKRHIKYNFRLIKTLMLFQIDGACWLKLAEQQPRHPVDIVIGDHIFDDYCVKYDAEVKHITFLKAKH